MKFNQMVNNIKKYKWKSLYFKYLKSVTIIVFVAFALYNIVLYLSYSYAREKDISSLASERMLRVSSNADNLFSTCKDYYNNAVANSYISVFLNNPQKPIGGYEVSAYLTPIINHFFKIGRTNEAISNMYLVSFASDYVLARHGGGNLNLFEDSLWYTHYEKTKDNHFIISDDDKNIIYNVWNLGDSGLLVMEIDKKIFLKQLVGNSQLKENEVYIYNLNQECILNDENEKTIQHLFENISIDEINSNTGNIKTQIEKSNVYSYGISEYELIYFTKTPIGIFKNQITFFMGIVILGSIAILIVLVLLSVLITAKMYNSIAEIITLFNMAETDENNRNFDETYYISKNIVSIMNKNQRVEKELVERLDALRKSQNMALQTQINPHFLFNTLQMVNVYIMSQFKRDNEATKIITLLSELLRLTFSTKNSLIPLEQEIQHAKKYLEIQNIRFDHIIHTQWNIDYQIENLKVLKLILQPFLENAVEHAMIDDEREFNIKIDGYIQADVIKIFISDDGAGIEKEKVDIINEKIKKCEIAEDKNIGILNVNSRLKLMFGDDYGVFMKSKINEGTTAEITLPILK